MCCVFVCVCVCVCVGVGVWLFSLSLSLSPSLPVGVGVWMCGCGCERERGRVGLYVCGLGEGKGRYCNGMLIYYQQAHSSASTFISKHIHTQYTYPPTHTLTGHDGSGAPPLKKPKLDDTHHPNTSSIPTTTTNDPRLAGAQPTSATAGTAGTAGNGGNGAAVIAAPTAPAPSPAALWQQLAGTPAEGTAANTPSGAALTPLGTGEQQQHHPTPRPSTAPAAVGGIGVHGSGKRKREEGGEEEEGEDAQGRGDTWVWGEGGNMYVGGVQWVSSLQIITQVVVPVIRGIA